MSKPSGLIFEIKCPCCDAVLQIDSGTQLVLNGKEVEKKPMIEDLRAAVQGLKGEEQRRNDIFDKSFASHKSGEQTRERKFEELLKQAKQDDPEARPKRPFDLD